MNTSSYSQSRYITDIHFLHSHPFQYPILQSSNNGNSITHKGSSRNKHEDCIVQWLTRSPDTREIPSSSLGIVIFLFSHKQPIQHKTTLKTLSLSRRHLLHLIIHLVRRGTHNEVADCVAGNGNVCIGAKDVNATRHLAAKTLRLVRQNDTTAGGVLNGVLRLSHLARNTTDRTTDMVSVQQANVFNLECFYRSSQTATPNQYTDHLNATAQRRHQCQNRA